LACLLSRYTAAAFISTCHGFFKPKLSRRFFPCWGDKVIAISTQVQEHLIKDFHLKEENIRLINNGIDVERFALRRSNDEGQVMKAGFGLKEGPVVGIIARLSEVKGHVYLIQAMKEVLRRFPDTQLLIVGQGKIKDDLIVLVKKLGIDDKVFFVPNIIDTAAALSIMDLFVLPSLHEGLGLSLMEAMAAGLPCIASNVGGIKSLIQDQVTGFLTAPKDPGQLSKAVVALLSDPDRAKSYGYNARKFILDNFSKDGMLEKTQKVYIECLKAKS
jgi:glycosyltransferase involved in cell wall biosynthesis